MRNVTKLILMGVMILSLVSCGKKNESGGGSSSSSSSDWYNQGSGNNGYGDYNTLKNYYNTKSLSSGTSSNMVIYHIGSAFGGTGFSNNNSFEFDFGFCINLFGVLKGDCNQYNPTNSLIDIVNKGEYKVIKAVSSSSLTIDVANGVSGNSFTFSPYTFNRSDSLFREMLNLDNIAVQKAVVSKATVYLTNGTKIDADYVEYFFNDTNQTVKGYVLSPDLPVLANPIAVTKNYDLTGVLNFAGSKTIRSISVNVHDLQYDYMTNEYRVITIGSRSVSF